MSRRKGGITPEEVEVLEKLHLQLRMSANASTEVRIGYYTEAKKQLGPDAARLAILLADANIPLNQLIQNYSGGPGVQNNNPGGTNVTQSAGGNMTGVNATGTQTIRDITVYSQDLEQAGVSINAGVRSALIEARESIEKSGIDAAMKPMVIEQFDKLTEELKKGDKKNAGVVSGLWNMVYGVVKAVPTAVAAVTSLEKLKG